MDLISRLEGIPIGKFHYKLLLLAGFGWMFDAMDTGLIAFVLPVLAAQWGLSAVQMGYIASAGLVGMALGAVVAGSVADRYGRKNVFAATMVLYGVATGLCGLAWDFTSLLWFRFLVGFGLGGELPVAATLISEYAPPASRGRLVVLLESFWGVGWLAAALVSFLIIPRWGWQSAFFIGALPALYVVFIRAGLPESVRYLIDKNRVAEAHAIVSNLERQAGIVPQEQAVVPVRESRRQLAIIDLWAPGTALRTGVLWILWFGIVYSYYGIFTWLPSLLVGQGYTIVKTFEYVLIITLAQLPGYFLAAYLVDRIGRKPTLVSFLTLCSICSYFFGQGGSSVAILWWGSLMAFFNLGAWGVVYTYTPELYPTRIRAFGSGWAAAVGRFGGILAPAAVGWMITDQRGFLHVFLMFAAVMLAVALFVYCFGEETKGKSLDMINK